MKFLIKSIDSELRNVLETYQYKQQWARNSRRILRAFRRYTGMDFQQHVITARVRPERQSRAGTYHVAMKLAGDFRNEEYKLMTIIHELAHRLLSGNVIGSIVLGLTDEFDPAQEELESEFEHRHIYLFLYDMITDYFGPEMAQVYYEYETRYDYDDPHQRAWNWAMALSKEQRQEATRRMAGQAVTRDKWNELQDPVSRDYEEWFDYLTGKINKHYPDRVTAIMPTKRHE